MGVRRLAVANGPNIFQMLLVIIIIAAVAVGRQVNVTRYFERCVVDYCSASGTRSDDVELEAARCVSLTAYSHQCTLVNNSGFSWRTDQLCREYRALSCRCRRIRATHRITSVAL